MMASEKLKTQLNCISMHRVAQIHNQKGYTVVNHSCAFGYPIETKQTTAYCFPE